MDPASGIGIPVAFGAGLISFLSPCVLPLVPGYISAVAGVAPSEIRARRVIGPSLAFVGSFSVIFIALGLLGQQALRGALTGPTALKVCGVLIVAMGVMFVLSPLIPRLAREWHVEALMSRAGRGGPVVTGAAFALAWTPCTGPTLGAIVSAAGASHSAAHGAVLLAVYCAGLGVPFLITGLAFGTATSMLSVVKRHYPVVIGTGGVVLIGMGVLIWTGEFTQLNITVNHWLQTLGLPDFNSST
ncbi:MAG: cytochrome c biogenesis CcdA family protein [Actinomycetota bacterium]|nr:cytochrome c biogenesis CcdA family protein [Actinomycetota bacterium]